MPTEQGQPIITQQGMQPSALDLSHIPTSIIEHHMVRAFDGQLSFQLDPNTMVSVDQLSREFTRRQQASDFNRS